MSYKNVLNTKTLETLVRKPHNAQDWARWMAIYQEKAQRDACKAMRVVVIEQTIRAVEQGQYTCLAPSSETAGQEEKKMVQVKLPSVAETQVAVCKTVVVGATAGPSAGGGAFVEQLWQREKQQKGKSKKAISCCFYTEDRDCIDVALSMQRRGLNPVVLNMTSSSRPGGGYRTGSAAQEESLFRRTDLYQHLEDPHGYDEERKWCYPLPEFGTAYSPDVCVFRGCEGDGYAFLPVVHRLAFVACAAYRNPPLSFPKAHGGAGSRSLRLIGAEESEANAKTPYRKPTATASQRQQHQQSASASGAPIISPPAASGVVRTMVQEPTMDKHKAEGMKRKIRAILATALLKHHDSIVLSAFGCGAYRCPPLHVAQLFRAVFAEKAFKDEFVEVAFAIIEDHNSRKVHNPNGNLRPFQHVFGTRSHELDSNATLATDGS